MHIVALGWIFVVLLMALAEATSTQGSLLGALITFVLYGVLPLSIVLYVMATPMRQRARRDAEQRAHHHDHHDHHDQHRAESPHDGDGRSHATTGAAADPGITPERKEP